MSTFFALLFIASLVLLAWGLIAPKGLSKFSKKPLTRRDAGIGFGLTTFVLMVLTSVTAPKPSVTITPQTSKPASTISHSAVKPAEKAPVITTKTTTETQSIPFDSKTVDDSSLDKGTTKVTTVGVNGVKTLTYQITYSDDKQTDKKLIKEEITQQPVTQVTSNGTYVKPQPQAQTSSNCDPNYSGVCVPNVYPSDVDCAGGSGNGPYYVSGPVYVTGSDRYGLDRDGNGVGCE